MAPRSRRPAFDALFAGQVQLGAAVDESHSSSGHTILRLFRKRGPELFLRQWERPRRPQHQPRHWPAPASDANHSASSACAAGSSGPDRHGDRTTPIGPPNGHQSTVTHACARYRPRSRHDRWTEQVAGTSRRGSPLHCSSPVRHPHGRAYRSARHHMDLMPRRYS
jgi:hypothetical protein